MSAGMDADRRIISLAANGAVSVDGVAIGTNLTRTQEAYLRAIFASKGVATREFILTTAYGGRDEPDFRIVDVIVCQVRRKLGCHREAIMTSWGRGFCRNPAYALAAAERTVGVNVDSGLIEELSHATGEEPNALVTRLLKAERERVWA